MKIFRLKTKSHIFHANEIQTAVVTAESEKDARQLMYKFTEQRREYWLSDVLVDCMLIGETLPELDFEMVISAEKG